jgi:UDP-N-acetylmuramoylalanine--D-glutamate ligase
MNLRNKNIGIFGLSRTGISCFRYLHKTNNVICFDDNEQARQKFAQDNAAKYLVDLYQFTFETRQLMHERCISRICERGRLQYCFECDLVDERWKNLDYIIVSPGVPLQYPTLHTVSRIADAHNIEIISDIEILFSENTDAKFIGITGTNGKSTTTALIGHILQDRNFATGGNIGTPCLDLSKSDGYVLELSSYQLDLLKNFKPNIAAIINITPDHLERYPSMQDYVQSKLSIAKNMNKDDYLVLNIDDEILNSVKNKFSHTNVITISVESKSADIFYHQNKIVDTILNITFPIKTSKNLQGQHNLYNILTAYSICSKLGLKQDEILQKISSFSGMPHRLQFIGNIDKINFYNDSKATNAEATSNALKALRGSNIFWLAGGIAKEGGINSILHLLGVVKKAYFFGQARFDFRAQAESHIKFIILETLEEAFEEAMKDALKFNESCSILLSPACASFDQFKNFEERGEKFINLVKQTIK